MTDSALYAPPIHLLGGRQVHAPGQTPAARAAAQAAEPGEGLWGADGFGFDDLIDIVNPLHHLPIVGPIYRELSGDTIAAAPRVVGGGLFGGIIGLVASMVDVAVKNDTGKDVGGHVIAFLTGDDGDAPATPVPEVLVAEVPPPDREDGGPIRLLPDEPGTAASDAGELTEAQWQALVGSLAAPATSIPQRPAPAPIARRAADEPGERGLSEAQWQALVGALADPAPAAAVRGPEPAADADREARYQPATHMPPARLANADFVALMNANLEKYDAMQRATQPAAAAVSASAVPRR